jgi:hypothetical protein
VPVGKGCPGTGGLTPQLVGRGAPFLGNGTYANLLTRGRPNSAVLLFWGIGPSELDIGFGCRLHFDVFQFYFVFTGATNAAGNAVVGLPIPNDPSLFGGQAFTQADVLDPNGAYQNIVSISNGVEQVMSNR